MATVIVGAGIIGSATAYYLSQSTSTTPSTIHLVESSPELFASASGYAAGFLARDWFSSPSSSLGALSFDLHKQLAQENNGSEKWGYSRSTGTSLIDQTGQRGEAWCREGASRAEVAGEYEFIDGKGPAWLSRKHQARLEVISDGDSTAQVDPLRLSRFLLSICVSRGVHLHQPFRPIAITTSPDTGALSSVLITSTASSSSLPQTQPISIPCTRLILTAGAWTPTVFSTLFPASKLDLPISSLAGHSLLLRTPKWNVGDEKKKQGNYSSHHTHHHHEGKEEGGCHAVFTTDPAGYSPEIFSRSNGEIYLAGLNSSTLPLPEVATARVIDGKSIKVLRRTAERLLGGHAVRRYRHQHQHHRIKNNNNAIELEGSSSFSATVRSDGSDADVEDSNSDLEPDSNQNSNFSIIREGLCFRPVTAKGTPLISKIDNRDVGLGEGKGVGEGKSEGVWVAAGHGPWGISLSLGTGKVVAEMVEGKERLSAEVAGLGFGGLGRGESLEYGR